MYVTIDRSVMNDNTRLSFSLTENEVQSIINKMIKICKYPTYVNFNSKYKAINYFSNKFSSPIHYEEYVELKKGDIVLLMAGVNNYKLFVYNGPSNVLNQDY